jgi:hypothetical protein
VSSLSPGTSMKISGVRPGQAHHLQGGAGQACELRRAQATISVTASSM